MRGFFGLVMAFLVGALFAVGLGVGGMLQGDRVVGFLNVLGGWDPTLALVMAGSIASHRLTWRLVTQRPHPVFGATYLMPSRADIDVPLVAGAALFGAGWGLGGYCPGPGIASVGTGYTAALVFVPSMLVGMALYHVGQRLLGMAASEDTPNVIPTPAR